MKNNFLITYTFLILFISKSLAQPIGLPINTPLADEFHPCVTGNSRTIIFEQGQLNATNREILTTTQYGGKWLKPKPIPGATPEISTLINAGYFINFNGDKLLFHTNRYQSVGGTDIWTIEKNASGNWGTPQNIGKPINTSTHEIDPCLSPDNKTLFFVRISDEKTPEGNACGNLYMSTLKNNGYWTDPIALPSTINNGKCSNPRLLADGKTFLFSSIRPQGKGGLDIYVCKMSKNGSFSSPIALTNINTPKDDRYVSVPGSGTIVYYSKQNDKGSYDVARTMIPLDLQPEKITLLQGKVYDQITKKPIIPIITITSLASGEENEYLGGNDGTYTVPILQSEDYDISITAKEGTYAFYSFIHKKKLTEGYNEILKNIELTPFTSKGNNFTLTNFSFDQNTDKISITSKYEIIRLAQLIKRAKGTVSIEVHCSQIETDSVAKPNLTSVIIDTIGEVKNVNEEIIYNIKTTYSSNNTKQQAKSIDQVLIEQKVPSEKYQTNGKGDKFILYKEPDKSNLNNRIIIKLQ